MNTPPPGSSEPSTGSLIPSADFVVSDQDLIYFRAIVQYGVQVAVQMFGIATNIINILVFTRMGLNESMTITFLGLALSDLLHLVCYLIYRLIPLIHFYSPIKSGVAPLAFPYPFSLYTIYFNDVSMYITVFAALQKCCCVKFPLKFKNTFTKRRTYAIIAVEFIVTLAIYLPVLTGVPFALKVNPITNKTLLTIKVLSHFRSADFYWQSVVKVALTPISQLIVIVCLVVMTKTLQASADFRSSSKTTTATASPNTENTNTTSRDVIKMGKNEIRALRAVQFVCFTFIVASLPPTVVYVIQSVYPPLSTPYMLNLKHVVYNSMYFLGTINASVNIFFYLKFNTNYKHTFWRIFSCLQCVTKT